MPAPRTAATGKASADWPSCFPIGCPLLRHFFSSLRTATMFRTLSHSSSRFSSSFSSFSSSSRLATYLPSASLFTPTPPANMKHHLMVGTWTPPGRIYTVAFDDEALTLDLVKKTDIPEAEPISWMTFSVGIAFNASSAALCSLPSSTTRRPSMAPP